MHIVRDEGIGETAWKVVRGNLHITIRFHRLWNLNAYGISLLLLDVHQLGWD